MSLQDISAASSSSAPLEDSKAAVAPADTPAAATAVKVPLIRQMMAVPGLLPGLTIIALLVIWELATRIFPIPSFILPAPTRIGGAIDAVPADRWF
ncbi:MAG: hypothetical protein JJ849_16140, partial [Rhizobiales bacterium]|nr:hypothetical protein [Hyphomicrobiales bacterium]